MHDDRSVTILSVEDHGLWRGHREWTVRIDGPRGVAQVTARDVDTETDAVARATQMYLESRVFTPEENVAMQRTSDALRRGLL